MIRRYRDKKLSLMLCVFRAPLHTAIVVLVMPESRV
jgi:hypothetical protein